jgi:hypothetical protein
MSKIFALFNIFAGCASLLGLIITIHNSYLDILKPPLYVLTAVLSFYVLFVPNNRVQKNVDDKLRVYRHPERTEEKLYVQKGVFEIDGGQTMSVEFPLPFANPPKVHIISNQNAKAYPPIIEEVTRYDVSFYCDSGLATIKQRFTWVAEGKLLQSLG